MHPRMGDGINDILSLILDSQSPYVHTRHPMKEDNKATTFRQKEVKLQILSTTVRSKMLQAYFYHSHFSLKETLIYYRKNQLKRLIL